MKPSEAEVLEAAATFNRVVSALGGPDLRRMAVYTYHGRTITVETHVGKPPAYTHEAARLRAMVDAEINRSRFERRHYTDHCRATFENWHDEVVQCDHAELDHEEKGCSMESDYDFTPYPSCECPGWLAPAWLVVIG